MLVLLVVLLVDFVGFTVGVGVDLHYYGFCYCDIWVWLFDGVYGFGLGCWVDLVELSSCRLTVLLRCVSEMCRGIRVEEFLAFSSA
jgi:hypothetical protein